MLLSASLYPCAQVRGLLILDNILIYGGSFDPVHNGHLQTAIRVQNHFVFDKVYFLPCRIPVLKDKTVATAEQRIAMLKLALAEVSTTGDFSLDDCELTRNSPSYTSTTLRSYRKKYGDAAAITLLLGMDSFLQLPRWHEWLQLPELCNLLVMERPGFHIQQADSMLRDFLDKHHSDVLNQTHGQVVHFNAGSYNLSSTYLRKQLAEGNDVAHLIPKAVWDYIQNNKIYQNW